MEEYENDQRIKSYERAIIIAGMLVPIELAMIFYIAFKVT